MYFFNQGMAATGVFFSTGALVLRGAKVAVATVEVFDAFGASYSLTTLGPSLFMPITDQLTYNKNHQSENEKR